VHTVCGCSNVYLNSGGYVTDFEGTSGFEVSVPLVLLVYSHLSRGGLQDMVYQSCLEERFAVQYVEMMWASNDGIWAYHVPNSMSLSENVLGNKLKMIQRQRTGDWCVSA
jgi:hypothetical protein